MLTYAAHIHVYAGGWKRGKKGSHALTYADVCGRMLTYAAHIHVYAGGWKRGKKGSRARMKLLVYEALSY
jgi:hypothetical protein